MQMHKYQLHLVVWSVKVGVCLGMMLVQEVPHSKVLDKVVSLQLSHQILITTGPPSSVVNIVTDTLKSSLSKAHFDSQQKLGDWQ